MDRRLSIIDDYVCSLPEQKIWDEKGVCGENWKEGKLIY